MKFGWVFLGLVACGSDGSSPHDAAPHADTPIDTPVATKIVHGTGTTHYATDTGIVDVPIDFSHGYKGYGGATPGTFTGTADGAFDLEIPETSAATIQLDAATYIITGASAPDLSIASLGRPDGALATTSSTVAISATGLAAWAGTDFLEMFSTNSDAYAQGFQESFGTPLAAGATTITNQTFDWRNSGSPLPVAAKGDVTWMSQLAPTVADTFAIVAAGSANLTVVNGQAAGTPTSFTLAPVTADHSLALHWKRLQFAALGAQASPHAVPVFNEVVVQAEPRVLTAGLEGASADLLYYTPASAATDLDTTLAYGDPYPMTWDPFALVDVEWTVDVKLGTAAATQIYAAYSDDESVATLTADGTIVPKIGAPHDVMIGATNVSTATTTTTGVGLTPTVSWSAPTLGTAASYLVVVQEVSSSNNQTTLINRVSFITDLTSITLPPDVLVHGSTYVMQVIARTGASLRDTPVPSASFGTVTSLFSP
ncbi:MAG: fibronectin type III domain-containing protein [Kofleriaceae bacterium]